MNIPALIKPTSTSQGHPKFKKDTLTTLQLVKKYNPSFVTTFIVSQSEAQYLTGDDLRRYENMITLKKKKEINAKYTGLLKSKVNTGVTCKHKSVSTQNPKPPSRFGSTKTETKRRTDNLKSQKETSKNEYKEKSDVKEIFKSNIYYGSTSSSVNDFIKCATDHLPSPKDIIEKTGRRIQTFWNIQKSMECENSSSHNYSNCLKTDSEENQDYVKIHKNEIDTQLRTLFNRKQVDNNIVQEVEQNVAVCVDPQPESIFEGHGIDVILKSKAKMEKTVAGTTQTSTHKIAKRNCFSLYNICNANTCRVLYKNCMLCNRRIDNLTAYHKKLGALVPYNKTLKPDQVVEKQFLLKKQMCIIGFRSFQFAYYNVENATVEHILEYRFILDDTQTNNLPDIDLGKAEEIVSTIASTIQNFGVTMLKCGLSINITFKILVTFGIILSLWVVYILYRKSISHFAIK